MELNERVELIVYIYSIKQARLLRKYGDLKYVSRRMHYVVMYVDAVTLEQTITTLKKLKVVKKVERSSLGALTAGFANNQSLVDDDE